MSTTLADLWRVVVLGIVEGVTEFLPISSTGHLIIASDLLNFEGSLGGTFEIFIQLGAVLAVVWYYRRDLWQQVRSVLAVIWFYRRYLRLRSKQDTNEVPPDHAMIRFWLMVAIAFFPAAGIGFLLHDWIKERLFNPQVVASALIVGGVILLLIERRDHSSGTESVYDVTPKQALGIGLAQTLSLIPGASRSASSIIGGLLMGLDRPTAAAFSFYLAIPTLGLATLYELATSLDQISAGDALNLLVGTVVSFFVALLVISWLLRYIAHHDFKIFGWYRVVLGLIVLAWFWLVR
jgi:undecaprenyl-diphosphatase